MTYTTQAQIRAAFWEAHPDMYLQARARGTVSKGQNAQVTDTRLAFCDYVDMLARDGEISEALAARARAALRACSPKIPRTSNYSVTLTASPPNYAPV